MFMPVGSGLIQGTGVIPGAWDISTATFNQSYGVITNTAEATCARFNDDGTKLFVNDVGSGVDLYTLSTAWDVSTASHTGTTALPSIPSLNFGMAFKPDGTKIYLTDYSVCAVYEWTLSTAWDLSTASYVGSFSVSSQMGLTFGLDFKDDGTAMYVVGQTTSRVFEYSLSTAWSISSASYSGKSIDTTTQETGPRDVFIKQDGTTFIVCGLTSNDAIYEYTVSTPWDLDTDSYVQLFSTATQDNTPRGVCLKPDGTKMYVTGAQNDAIYEYDLGT